MSSAPPAGFELCPPGSFPLCADPQRQDEAARELQAVSEQVRARTRRYSALGLILTGSFARGEATLLADPEVGVRWLSDIECLVVFPADKRRAPIAEVDQLLRGIESERNLQSSNIGSGIKLELRSIQTPRLARLRPAIFSREFLAHGKLLWGEPAALPWPRWYHAGSEIPAADGFRLLNNRIMEQLAVRLNDERGSEDRISRSYWVSKFWIDLATSLSIFLHCYVTTYLGRQASIETTLAARPELFGDSFGRLFVTRLKESMAIKGGKLSAFNSYNGSLNEAASAAAEVWGWESDQLTGRSLGRGDWKSIVSRLRRAQTPSQTLRDWAKLLLRRGGRHDSRPSLIKSAFRAGSLANAIYGAGCLLDFYWDEIGSERSPGPEVASEVGKLLGVSAGRGTALRGRLVAAALDAWTVHLRFAAG
ncbi:MAG: hypothetical protein ACRD4E_09330 [Bryobacteraceae bacterium]